MSVVISSRYRVLFDRNSNPSEGCFLRITDWQSPPTFDYDDICTWLLSSCFSLPIVIRDRFPRSPFTFSGKMNLLVFLKRTLDMFTPHRIVQSTYFFWYVSRIWMSNSRSFGLELFSPFVLRFDKSGRWAFRDFCQSWWIEREWISIWIFCKCISFDCMKLYN